MTWSAPGKLFLFGEYAVLRGAPAIVTAVDRRVRVRAVDGPYRVVGAISDPNLPAAVAATTGGDVAGWEVDVRTMVDADAKLGLGSSAASCVALAAAMSGSVDPRDILRHALEAHRIFQRGAGSGGDIVASALGGTQLVARDHEPEQLTWPDGLSIRAVWMGRSANTRELVAAVLGSAAAREPLELLASLSQRAADAFRGGDAATLVDAAAEHDALLEALGQTAGVALRTAEHAELARGARALGAAAKPSGAGGGDISLVVSARPIDDDHLAEILPAGTRQLDLQLDQPGLSSP